MQVQGGGGGGGGIDLLVKIDILVKIKFVKINNLNQIREKIILQEEFLEKYDLVDPGLTK